MISSFLEVMVFTINYRIQPLSMKFGIMQWQKLMETILILIELH